MSGDDSFSLRDAMLATVVAERAGVLGHARAKCVSIDVLVAIGRLSADDATTIKRALRGFADEIATGLHRDEPDAPGVRAAMREVARG